MKRDRTEQPIYVLAMWTGAGSPCLVIIYKNWEYHLLLIATTRYAVRYAYVKIFCSLVVPHECNLVKDLETFSFKWM
jgi:hypothetical protein